MLDAIKKKYDEFQQARIRERVAQMNAETAAARDAEAKAEAARLAAVSQSVRAGRAERLAPPAQAGMARRPAPPSQPQYMVKREEAAGLTNQPPRAQRR